METGRTTPPQGIVPARMDVGSWPRRARDGCDLFEKFFHDALHGFGVARHAASQADLRDADAGDHPTDVAGGEFAVEEAVEAVGGGEREAGEFVLHAEQELLVLAKGERLSDVRVGTVGADQITGVAEAFEMVAGADFGGAGERCAAREFDARLLGLGREPADDVGGIGREKIVAGSVEIDKAHVRRVKADAGHWPYELRREVVEEGDLVDDFFDDDARGVELVAGILLTFEHADAQAAAGEHGRTCEAGEACADDGAVDGGRRGGQRES